MGKGKGYGEQNGKRRVVEAKGKGRRQQKEIMGKGRGCVEERWEEESFRRSRREGAQAVEGANWKRERLCRGRMGRGEQ
jgi:hypothetical protein